MVFGTYNATRMRIKENGKVAVGTASSHALYDTFTVGTTLRGTQEYGVTSMSILAPGERADAILYFGTQYNSYNTYAKKAAIIAEGVSSYSRSKLHFCLNDVASNSNSYNASISNAKMTILYNGNVGINHSSPSYKLMFMVIFLSDKACVSRILIYATLLRYQKVVVVIGVCI